jgi:hypothetical protein
MVEIAMEEKHLLTKELPCRRDLYTRLRGKTSICTAGDSTGQIIAFLLSAKRDAGGAKRSSEKAFNSSSNPIPRDIKCLALEGIETMSMIRERRIQG